MRRLIRLCLFLIALGFLALDHSPLSAQLPTDCQDICPWTPCPDAGNTTCYYSGFWTTCRDYGDCIPVAGGLTALAALPSGLPTAQQPLAQTSSPAQAASPGPLALACGIPPAAAPAPATPPSVPRSGRQR